MRGIAQMLIGTGFCLGALLVSDGLGHYYPWNVIGIVVLCGVMLLTYVLVSEWFDDRKIERIKRGDFS